MNNNIFSLKEAHYEDFESAYPLLSELNNTQLTKHDWRKLFIIGCETDEKYCGHILMNKEEVVGFFGLIFSRRIINGTIDKFCNLTSWILKKEYRGRRHPNGQGFAHFLFQHQLQSLEDYTITALTPLKATENMLKKYGFKQLETEYVIILPLAGISYVTDRCSVLIGHDAVINPPYPYTCNMDEEDIKIYHDHIMLKCIHIVLRTLDEYCYIIATKTIRKKRLIFAEIHYISNIQMFIRHIQYLRITLPLRLCVCGLVVEKRILRGYNIGKSVTRTLLPTRFYKSNVLDKSYITDNLYTELLVLV